MMTEKINIFWFRRDLRLKDNHGLFEALKKGSQVLPIFIFDTEILNQLEDKSDKRLDFIVQALQLLNEYLSKQGKSIKILFGKPLEIFKELVDEYTVESVYCNEDYEPYAIKRDEEIRQFLKEKGIKFYSCKDQVIFQKDEILKADGTPYTVYTPYSKQWLLRFTTEKIKSFPSENYFEQLVDFQQDKISIEALEFKKTDYTFSAPEVDRKILEHYGETRNFPFLETSKMGVHLRFGTVSVRRLVAKAVALPDAVYLKELIWREFFMQILYHFPRVVNKAFKPQYDEIKWLNNEEDFEKWKTGNTGFPMVDAGMRELNATGFMHNRARMVCASFLTKHLLTDWRIGEAYFAQKLMDFDLSANNGNWQWSAGSGCDAAPYFRIFNPMEQQKKFDPNFTYIKKWIPELNTNLYAKPMIDHTFARNRALEVYGNALKLKR